MLRFPFNSRPMPTNMSSSKPDVNENKIVDQGKEIVDQGKEIVDNNALSPELNLLLSMSMKDGLEQNKTLSMLEGILPFISGKDKQTIQGMLGTSDAGHNQQRQMLSQNNSSLAGFTKQNRWQEMMNIMQRYAGDDTGGFMNEFEKSMEMQKNFEDMSKRMEKLSNTENASPQDMIDLMSSIMPDSNMSQMKNMSSMMKMMNMMGGNSSLKPEDLMKMMNMNK